MMCSVTFSHKAYTLYRKICVPNEKPGLLTFTMSLQDILRISKDQSFLQVDSEIAVHLYEREGWADILLG